MYSYFLGMNISLFNFLSFSFIILMYYYVNILGLLVGVDNERELQIEGKTTKLNVIVIEVDEYYSYKV